MEKRDFTPLTHRRRPKEINIVREWESLVKNCIIGIECMSDTFPLLLKEGWPDHILIKIQMMIPAGVVDCYLSSK
jgi:hypothetical protein